MLFISAVPQAQNHVFTPCTAKTIASAKAMASKLVTRPGMKAAVAVGEYGQHHFIPVAEIVFLPGQTWQSLCPSPLPVSLAAPSGHTACASPWTCAICAQKINLGRRADLAPSCGGMGGMPPMVTSASAPASSIPRGATSEPARPHSAP